VLQKLMVAWAEPRLRWRRRLWRLRRLVFWADDDIAVDHAFTYPVTGGDSPKSIERLSVHAGELPRL
jgi:hypothetical protein